MNLSQHFIFTIVERLFSRICICRAVTSWSACRLLSKSSLLGSWCDAPAFKRAWQTLSPVVWFSTNHRLWVLACQCGSLPACQSSSFSEPSLPMLLPASSLCPRDSSSLALSRSLGRVPTHPRSCWPPAKALQMFVGAAGPVRVTMWWEHQVLMSRDATSGQGTSKDRTISTADEWGGNERAGADEQGCKKDSWQAKTNNRRMFAQKWVGLTCTSASLWVGTFTFNADEWGGDESAGVAEQANEQFKTFMPAPQRRLSYTRVHVFETEISTYMYATL